MRILTGTVLLVAILGRSELADAFLAAVLGQLRVLPCAPLCAAAASLVALVPGVFAHNAVD